MMDRLINNLLMLAIATRGSHGYVLPLLSLFVLTVLLLSGNSKTNSLIITGRGTSSHHSLKLSIDTMHKILLLLDISIDILGGILR